jgi:hypothetical protein
MIKLIFTGRPVWMTALLLFCGYMTFIYMPFDLFYKPVAEDVEVWFGLAFHGWAAKATEPIHWLIYGAGFYGFLKMKSWMFPWAAIYVAQVAIAMFLWPIVNDEGNVGEGIVSGAVFVLLGIALWLARDDFRH